MIPEPAFVLARDRHEAVFIANDAGLSVSDWVTLTNEWQLRRTNERTVYISSCVAVDPTMTEFIHAAHAVVKIIRCRRH